MMIRLSAVTIDALGIQHEYSVSNEADEANVTPKELLDAFYDQCARIMEIEPARWDVLQTDDEETTDKIRRP